MKKLFQQINENQKKITNEEFINALDKEKYTFNYIPKTEFYWSTYCTNYTWSSSCIA